MCPKLNPEEVKKLNTGKCPDCGGQLLEGPRGGFAMNIKCESCGQVFWVSWPPFIPERI